MLPILYASLKIGISPYLIQYRVVLQFTMKGVGRGAGEGRHILWPSI